MIDFNYSVGTETGDFPTYNFCHSEIVLIVGCVAFSENTIFGTRRSPDADSATHLEYDPGPQRRWLSHREHARRRQPAGPVHPDRPPIPAGLQKGTGQSAGGRAGDGGVR